MNRQSTSRIVSVVLMLFCMLCEQIAAAECKAMRNAGNLAAVNAQTERPKDGFHRVADLGEGMRDSAPDLCKKQMQAPDDAITGIAGAQPGAFLPFIAAMLQPVLPQRHAPAPLPKPTFVSMHARATAPPLRIRHCSFRI